MEIANSIYDWFTVEDSSCIKHLSDNQILCTASEINSIFSDSTKICMPKMVVVGTQSSGKSSVLNGIVGMDILPTGKSMVTRTPLEINLHKTTESPIVEFGEYINQEWIVYRKINITVPTPTDEEIADIRHTIMSKTVELAGNGMDVCSTPIIMDIYSPYVPNLSLTDLPGLTMVACVDKGQPENIKDKIEDLVLSYIRNEKTVSLLVVQAKSDIETDLGLALVKKYNYNGLKTVGVLTKPDLMNERTDVGDYLINSISKNLMLEHGYYVVKNRSDTSTDISKGFILEKEYFSNHNEYKKNVYRGRTGTPSLTSDLSKLLVDYVLNDIPVVMNEIHDLDIQVSQKLVDLGDGVPSTKDGQMVIVNNYVSNFYYKFTDSLKSRCISTTNVGKSIKDVFIKFRKDIHLVNPFNNTTVYSPEYFDNIVSSFEGNHMSFHISPVKVLEACMMDPVLAPVMVLKTLSVECTESVCCLLKNLAKDISKSSEFCQFPALGTYITDIVASDIVDKLKIDTLQRITLLLEDESKYIWTDEPQFVELLRSTTSVDSVVNMLESYYSTVKITVANSVPKIIMNTVVNSLEKQMLSYLVNTVVVETSTHLLKEDSNVDEERKHYSKLKNKIEHVRQMCKKNSIF